MRTKKITLLYLLYELIIFAIFEIMALFSYGLPFLRYSLIIINFLYGIYIIKNNYSLDNLFLILGLFFTIISDYFLLINENDELYIVGIITFIIVQFFYFLRNIILNKINKKEIIAELIIRLILFTLIIILIDFFMKDYFNYFVSLALFYFINLFMNFVISFKFRNKSNNKMLSLGLFLFILCDIMVGLNFIINNYLVNYLMWTFYAPSQVLITLSIKCKK